MRHHKPAIVAAAFLPVALAIVVVGGLWNRAPRTVVIEPSPIRQAAVAPAFDAASLAVPTAAIAVPTPKVTATPTPTPTPAAPRLSAKGPTLPPEPPPEAFKPTPPRSTPTFEVTMTAPVVTPVAIPTTAPTPTPRATPAPVASPPPASAVSSAASAAPPGPSTREIEMALIQSVLDRYRLAFNSLDVSSVSTFWPSVNSRTLSRAFDQLQSQSVTFDSCRIDIKGDVATSACTGKASFTPKVGNKTPRVESRRWTFQFARMPDKWIIVDVDAR